MMSLLVVLVLQWDMISTGAPSPRTEVRCGDGADDGTHSGASNHADHLRITKVMLVLLC